MRAICAAPSACPAPSAPPSFLPHCCFMRSPCCRWPLSPPRWRARSPHSKPRATHPAADGAREKPSDPVRQLAEFYRFFPKSSQAPDDLAKLHALAAVHGVQLDQGTYRLLRDRVGKLSMYEIALPVKGDYSQLRKFMSQALTEIPYLSLDSVSFQRQKAGDTMLESQIKFTLFLAEAP
jgi:hypothetical protein